MSIQTDVERGLEIRTELLRLKTELAAIEGRLVKSGLAHPQDHEDLKDADREGRQWLAQGTAHVVPVIFTADKLIQSFKANSATQQTIKIPARGRIEDFYSPSTTWEINFDDGKKFRQAALDILGASFAPPFVSACLARDKHGIPKSDVKILWEDAESKI